MSEHHPLSPSNLIAGLIITIVGGLVVAYLTRQEGAKISEPESSQVVSSANQIKETNDVLKASSQTTNELASAFIFTTDSSKHTTPFHEGILAICNKTELEDVDVAFYSVANSGIVYALNLKKEYHNENSFAIPTGLYIWKVETDPTTNLYGGVVNISEGMFKKITLLKHLNSH